MRSTRKTPRRTLIGAGLAAALLTTAYALTGFALAPRIVGRLLDHYVTHAPDRALTVGHIAVNPFTLTVTLDRVDLSDSAAGIELGADRAELNFSIAALTYRHITLDAVTLESPRGAVAGGWPASGIGPLVDRWAARLAELSPPLRIGRLEVSQGRFKLGAADGLTLYDVSLTADRLVTDAATPAAYTLSLAEAGGVRLHSQGQVAIAVPSADGRLELTGLDLARWPVDRSPGVARSGELELRGVYRISGEGAARTASLSEAMLSVRDFEWPTAGGATAAAASVTTDFEASLSPATGGIDIDSRFSLDGSEVSITDGAADPSAVRFDRLGVDGHLAYGPDRIRLEGSAEGDDAVLEPTSDPDSGFSVGHLTAGALSATGSPLAIEIGELGLEGLRGPIDTAPAGVRFPAWLRPPFGRRTAPRTFAPWRVSIARAELADAAFDLRDPRFDPPVSIPWHGVNGELVAVSDTGTPGMLELEGTVGEAGSAQISGRLMPAGSADSSHFDLSVDALEAPLFSPYALRFGGHSLREGSLSGELSYGLGDNRLDGSMRVVSSGLELGPATTTTPAQNPPLPLALTTALLKDPSGRLEISVPLSAQLPRADANVPAIVGGTLAASIAQTAAQPFDALARAIGTTASMLVPVPFVAGSAEITAPASERLNRLAAALVQRPGVALTVGGGFDRKADRDALAAQQIRLHVALATAGAAEFGAAQLGEPPPVDFASPRAQDVLDEFAGERLGAQRVRAIAARFPSSASDEPPARRDYYHALYDALVAQEPIEDAALVRLGRYRAQSIVDALGRLDLGATRLRLTGMPSPAGAAGQDVLVPLGVATLEEQEAP